MQRDDIVQTKTRELIWEHLISQSLIALVAVLLVSLIYTLLSWNHVPKIWLILWLCAQYTLAGIRFYLIKAWRSQGRNISRDKLDNNFRILNAGAALSGFLWGITGFLFLQESSIVHFTFTSFVLAGMTAGALSAYSGYLPILFSYSFFLLAPYLLKLLFFPGLEYKLMASMVFLYFVLMMKLGTNFQKHILNTIRLGFENEDLTNKLNSASHEIRTPLAAIIGFAEVLQGLDRSDDVHRYSSRIVQNGIKLKNLINDILSVAKTDRPDSREDIISIEHELSSIVDLFERDVKNKGLSIKFEIQKEVPEYIIYDRLKFNQIVTNLVSNSIKYTNKGRIKIEAVLKNPQFISINVCDTGVGIKKESTEKIFKYFYREDRVEVESQDGSGLGLSIAKNLAHSQGGDVLLKETQENGGSTFEFILNIVLPKVIPRPPLSAENRESGKIDLKSKGVLLVEDNPDLAFLIKHNLESKGVKIFICHDGKEAVDFVREKSIEIDVILMDLNMPTMDGFEATQFIRKLKFDKPIYAMSAYSPKTIEEECLKKGFDGCIGKPIDFTSLHSLICPD